MKPIFLVAGAILFSSGARACMWDTDTLETEARGVPTAIKAVSGRFERNPALYYEMRLQRVTAQIAKTPRDFNLYDDAAVAHARLGKPTLALQIIERKRAAMEPLNAQNKDHWYRYYANAGTISMQKWLLEGADKSQISDLKMARDQIKRAIEINPDAHFGREKYQLGYIEWLLNPKVLKDTTAPLFWDPEVKNADAAKAVEGISGLVTEGLGWENVDVFRALGGAIAFDEERNYAAFLAVERAGELTRAGGQTLDPAFKKIPVSQHPATFHSEYPNGHFGSVRDEQELELKTTFKKLRAEADNYHIHRTDYMLQKLKKGEHPDTHPNFWSDYVEAPTPIFDGNEMTTQTGVQSWPAMLSLVAVGIGSGFLIQKKRRVRG